MHPLDNNKAPLILWSTDGYNFKAETFGNGLASDYQYWTFDYLIAYNGEFVGEAIYRWSNGYECRVFHAPTIEEFINVSTYQATKTTITNSWIPLPNANEWYERTEQYGQAIVEMVWSDNNTWCPHTLIDAALKPHYFDSAEYTRDTGTTVNVNNGVTFRKIGKYFFMFSKYATVSAMLMGTAIPITEHISTAQWLKRLITWILIMMKKAACITDINCLKIICNSSMQHL